MKQRHLLPCWGKREPHKGRNMTETHNEVTHGNYVSFSRCFIRYVFFDLRAYIFPVDVHIHNNDILDLNQGLEAMK